MKKAKSPTEGIFDAVLGIPVDDIINDPNVIATLSEQSRSKIMDEARQSLTGGQLPELYLHGYEQLLTLETIRKVSLDRLIYLGTIRLRTPADDDAPTFQFDKNYVLAIRPDDMDLYVKAEGAEHLGVIQHTTGIINYIDRCIEHGMGDFVKTLREIIATARMIGLHQGLARAYTHSWAGRRAIKQVRKSRAAKDKGRPRKKMNHTIKEARTKHPDNLGMQAQYCGVSKKTLKRRIKEQGQ